MAKAELCGVQELATEFAKRGTDFRILDCLVASATINLIAHNRMFQPGQVDADLVRASCLDLDIYQREAIIRMAHEIERQSRAATTNHGPASAVARIASDRLIDLS